MYDNFLNMVCQNENLIDIGYLGKANQSSLSQWSIREDANRATDGKIYKDFAFHTDKQSNPWWEITFDTPYVISYIIINNRKKKPFNRVSENLKVSCFYEDDSEVEMHSGSVTFGSLPESLPLIIQTNKSKKIKSIKLQIPGQSYLHLNSINILAKYNIESHVEKPLFLAMRNDGLGERLKAIINCIILAGKTKGDFGFTWSSELGLSNFHDTNSVKDIFNSNFINSYYKTKEQLEKYDILKLKNIKSEDFMYADAIKVEHTPIKDQNDDRSLYPSPNEYKEAFDSINFNQDISKAIFLAENISVSKNTIAIHLRSGDIVYGIYRFMNKYYHKSMPIYILDKIITDYQLQGYDVLIFGQDKIFCNFVSNKYNVRYSDNLLSSDYSDTQRAFFDIILMSRCSEIIAGGSGFAILSQLLGNIPRKRFYELISDNETITSFNEASSSGGILENEYVSPLLKAFSYATFFDEYSHKLDSLQKIHLMSKAFYLDPENSYYALILALTFYENEEITKGDLILYEELIKDKDYGILWLAKEKGIRGAKTILETHINEIKVVIGKGSAIAVCLLFFYEQYTLIKVNQSYYKDKLLEFDNDVIGVDLLRNIVSEFKST